MSEESLLRVCGEEFPSKNLSEKITMNSIKGHLVSQGRRSHPTTRIRGEPTCFSKSGVSAPLIQVISWAKETGTWKAPNEGKGKPQMRGRESPNWRKEDAFSLRRGKQIAEQKRKKSS